MSVVATGETSDLTPHPFEFRGNGVEYFWICIRTLLLAVITLGIYDAWGTVERRRYFWGNTVVAGHGFDYHARPVQILVGRLIIIGILIAYNIVVAFFPLVTLAVLPALFLLIPWIFNRVLSFQLGNTSYRNVRFSFHGDYWNTLIYVVLLPFFAMPMTMGFIYPLNAKLLQEYIVSRLQFGRSDFSANIPLRPLYRVYLIGFAIIAVSFLATIGLMFANHWGGFTDMLNAGTKPEIALETVGQDIVWYLVIAGLVIFVGNILLRAVFAVHFRNEFLRVLELQGGHRFDSNLPVGGYIWRIVSRVFLATISFGLLSPWANVDIHRYLMSHTALLANSDLDSFIGDHMDAGGAAAAEYGIMDGVADGAFGA